MQKEQTMTTKPNQRAEIMIRPVNDAPIPLRTQSLPYRGLAPSAQAGVGGGGGGGGAGGGGGVHPGDDIGGGSSS